MAGSGRWAVGLAAILCGAAAWLSHENVTERREAFAADSDVLYVPPANYLRPMSLGYREALADLIWVRALIFSGERIGNTDVAAVGRYVDAITGLAPRFRRAYVWGGVTPIYGGGAHVTREMVDQSIATYRKGIEQFPESHELLYPAGMLLTHQVSSTPGYSDEEQAALAAEGVEMIRRAAAFGADPLVRQYAATLVADHATEPLARQFLESQLAQAEDPDYRRMLRKQLATIGGQKSVDAVERTRTAFAREHLTQRPFVPDTVYAVIRDEATAARSSDAAGEDDDSVRPSRSTQP